MSGGIRSICPFHRRRIGKFNEIAKRIPEYDPARAIIIGDSLTSDIQGGINAGIDTCWYNPEEKKAPEGMNITYTVSKLSEIEDIV